MYPVILLFYCKKNKKTKLFKKKKQNRRQGLWRKKRKKKTKKQRRRKGLRPPVSQSNLFPLHLHWLKRQSVTSFYPFFVCFHFLVRCWHGVFQQFRRYGRYGPSQRESAWIGPSLSRVGASQCELWQKKKKNTNGRMRHQRTGSSVPRMLGRIRHGCGSSGTASVLPRDKQTKWSVQQSI